MTYSYSHLPGITVLLCLVLLSLDGYSFQTVGAGPGKQDSLTERWVKACADLREKGDYTAALEDGLKALEAYRQSGNTARAAWTNMEIAQIYMFLGEQKSNPAYINQGEDYARTAYETYQSIQDTAGEAISHNVQGIIYRSTALLGKPAYYDSALTMYREALALISPSGKGKKYTGMLYNNISQVYSEYKKDYPTALHYLQAAVAFNKETNNIVKLSFNYGNIAQVYMEMGDKKSSLEYAYRTLDLAKQINTANRLVNAYQQLYESYHHFGISDSALHYYILYDNLRDSISSLTTTRQIAEAQAKYETEKNKTLIGDLNNRNSLQNKKIVFLVSGISLLLFFLLGLYWLLRRVRHQKQLISEQTGQLEIIMKELHHRVKNNLQVISSLLSLQSYKLQDEEALEAIRLSQQRVQAMSFIHQRLYTGGQSRMVNMQEYLSDLASSLVTAYGFTTRNFNLQIDAAKEWVDVDKAMPMGLIANEIITNALKYAYAGSTHPALYIELREEKGSLLFVLKDNGQTWDERKWKEDKGSFGRQLVESLCRQLNATQELAMRDGSAFIFTIPQERAA
jgi:two-component sensor histidine kinase